MTPVNQDALPYDPSEPELARVRRTLEVTRENLRGWQWSAAWRRDEHGRGRDYHIPSLRAGIRYLENEIKRLEGEMIAEPSRQLSEEERKAVEHLADQVSGKSSSVN